jgi:penicillin-binding protein 2
MVDYSGFQFVKSSLRTYTAPTLANTLGYVSEITKKQLDAQEEPYYRQSDYIGQSGVEKIYENELRGKRGTKFVMQNVAGVYKGPWKGGELDTMAVAGSNLYSGIDLETQQYADSLMGHKVGSVVAIEPSTGQIISMVSAPTYDPNILASRFFSKNYSALVRNPFKPLFNRPVMASYRPGSTFKLIQALVGLQEGVVTPGSGFSHANCPVGCHNHAATTSIALGVTHSCNPYFYHLFRRVIYNNKISNTFKASAAGLEDWHTRVSKFGIGQQLGIDLPSERKGNLPDKKYYDKIYGENAWKFSNIYSISIGEGEILITPLKMANVAAIIANKGYFYTPHVIHGVGDQKKLDPMYTTRRETNVDARHFAPVIEGMIGAIQSGTAKSARIEGITVAGKTGTSQNKKGDDHSIFIGFAPVENPKIAIAVFVENGGFGGQAAAPIAGLIMEKYLTGKVTNKALEKRMMELNLLNKVVLTPEQRAMLKSDTLRKKAPESNSLLKK